MFVIIFANLLFYLSEYIRAVRLLSLFNGILIWVKNIHPYDRKYKKMV